MFCPTAVGIRWGNRQRRLTPGDKIVTSITRLRTWGDLSPEPVFLLLPAWLKHPTQLATHCRGRAWTVQLPHRFLLPSCFFPSRPTARSLTWTRKSLGTGESAIHPKMYNVSVTESEGEAARIIIALHTPLPSPPLPPLYRWGSWSPERTEWII